MFTHTIFGLTFGRNFNFCFVTFRVSQLKVWSSLANLYVLRFVWCKFSLVCFFLLLSIVYLVSIFFIFCMCDMVNCELFFQMHYQTMQSAVYLKLKQKKPLLWMRMQTTKGYYTLHNIIISLFLGFSLCFSTIIHNPTFICGINHLFGKQKSAFTNPQIVPSRLYIAWIQYIFFFSCAHKFRNLPFQPECALNLLVLFRFLSSRCLT